MSRTVKVIDRVSDVAGDGSQDIWVQGADSPFHVDAAWLASQAKAPEVNDGLVEDRGALSLESAEVVSTDPDAQNGEQEAEGDQKKTDGGEGSDNGSDSSPANYRALPIEVEAYQITSVAETPNADGSLDVALSNGQNVQALPEMLARITPQTGDYWVISQDGYVYLNPKAVFESKYEAI